MMVGTLAVTLSPIFAYGVGQTVSTSIVCLHTTASVVSLVKCPLSIWKLQVLILDHNIPKSLKLAQLV